MNGMLSGLRPLLVKELREWWGRRAAQTTVIVVTLLTAIGTLAMRIDELGGGIPVPGGLVSTTAVLGSKLDQWVVLAAIFGSLGLLTTERATGTLAWTLSQPVSRPALLVAKWIAAVVVLAITAVAIPLGVSVLVATQAYGTVPDLAVTMTFGVLLLSVAASFVALELALATALDSQAGIAAIAFAVFATPYILGAVLPGLVAWWPTSIGAFAGEIALGEPLPIGAVIAWAGGLLVAAIVGPAILRRRDL